MEATHKQLVLNKGEDWRFVLSRNVEITGDSVTLCRGQTGGYFCLEAIDGGENGFVWQRVSLDCRLPRDSVIRTLAFACDSRLYGGGELEKLLAALEPGQEGPALERIFVPVGKTEDFYINVKGRYLWLMFELISPAAPPVLQGVRLHMYGDHMASYLPAIYREDDFTRRFLSVFDSFFMDMEREIIRLPARFDYEKTDRQMLEYMANWVCVEAEGLSEEALVGRVSTALDDYREMYTLKGVKKTVYRLTGKAPIIIEGADVDPNGPGCTRSELYRRLYGQDPHKFFVLLEEDTFKSRAQMEAFLEKLRLYIPADTGFELVLLKRCVKLDWHSYLGVNSVLNDYTPVVVDENTTIHYDTMIGGHSGARI